MLLKFISICLSFLVICDANRCSSVTVPVCDNALDEMWEKVRELERIVASINLRTTLLIEDGWTVFQRRFNGSVDFYRNWTDYKYGFGDFSGEFWLGLERIHTLTFGKQCLLRIDLYDFNDSHAFAVYSSFSVGNEAGNYTLLVGWYTGTTGDSLEFHNGMQFSTKDRDHDRSSGNCASEYHGAWWFNMCHHSHLNGEWARTSSGPAMNIAWRHWRGHDVPLKATTMKLRCD